MATKSTFNEETKEAGQSAFFEVCVITILSLVPLFLIAYYQYVVQDAGFSLQHTNPHHASLYELMYRNTAAGQLAFYAIANWAAVAWICGIEKKVHIPMRPIFIVFCVIGFAYCGVLIAITAATNYTPSAAVTVPSGITYFVSIFCYFLLLLFEKITPPSAEDTNMTEASNLHRKVNALRGGQNG